MRVSPSKSTPRYVPVARGSSTLLEAPSGRTRVLTCIRLCTETPRAGAHTVFEEVDEKFIQLAHETKCMFPPKPETHLSQDGLTFPESAPVVVVFIK